MLAGSSAPFPVASAIIALAACPGAEAFEGGIADASPPRRGAM
jgi:hypothetical protein